jgi:hypothetical protein
MKGMAVKVEVVFELQWLVNKVWYKIGEFVWWRKSGDWLKSK